MLHNWTIFHCDKDRSTGEKFLKTILIWNEVETMIYMLGEGREDKKWDNLFNDSLVSTKDQFFICLV